jgi:hypothetical protein
MEDEERKRQVELELHVPDGRHRLLGTRVPEQLVDEADQDEGQQKPGPGGEPAEGDSHRAREDEDVHQRVADNVRRARREDRPGE